MLQSKRYIPKSKGGYVLIVTLQACSNTGALLMTKDYLSPDHGKLRTFRYVYMPSEVFVPI
jgi:hypothetical protein